MAPNTEILVVGMGAVGTMAAYALQASGKANVTAVLRSNYDIVEQKGFIIDSIDHGKIMNWRPHRTLRSVPNIEDNSHSYQLYHHRYDFIVLTTKNTPDVGPNLAELIAPAVTTGHTCIVLMQNGLNIEKPFQERFPHNELLSSVQLIGAEEASPGYIVHSEPDISYVGCFNSSFQDPQKGNLHLQEPIDTANLTTFLNLYNSTGKANARPDDNVRKTRWRKLIYNASYNSVSAITGLDVTRMRIHDHVIDNLVKPIMHEIMAIAAADGILLAEPPQTPDQLIHHFITIDKLSSCFMPSMGQDAAKNNYLEFENIVGEPLRVAQRLGVDCPTLNVVYGILKGMQARIREKRGDVKVSVEMAGRYK